MAEVLAVLGGVGSVCSIVNGITRIVGMISELQARWGDADLTLLSLASQLTALRAASTKIEEWIDQDLQDTHHQLVMDLDVSISCCRLLMNKVESFFSDLAQLMERPLDLREKFKIVFGSSGPESVQKLIEHQTSALTLLLTACNCKTISGQQRYLGTHKSRKVLHRAKADSMSLYVHRDTASFISKMTDNMSKISRVFEFDSNIFSTGVYERAFRGSVRDLLKRRQQILRSNPSATLTAESTLISDNLKDIRFLGPDQVSIDLLINTIRTDRGTPSNEWALYRSELQELCLSLVSNIIKSRPDFCDPEDFKVLTQYSVPYSRLHLVSQDALEACARIWNDAVQPSRDLDAAAYNSQSFVFESMVFFVQITHNQGLRITSSNQNARTFIHQMECGFFVSSNDPLQGTPRLADLLRAERMAVSSFQKAAIQDVAFQLTIGDPGSVTIADTNADYVGDETMLVFFLDLQDYGTEFDSLKPESLKLAELVTIHRHPVIGLVMRNFGRFVKQMETLASPLGGGVRLTRAHIIKILKSHIKIKDWDFSFILDETDDMHPAETLVRLQEIVSGIAVRARPPRED